jgi:phosphate transport system substrate-binding protein
MHFILLIFHNENNFHFTSLICHSSFMCFLITFAHTYIKPNYMKKFWIFCLPVLLIISSCGSNNTGKNNTGDNKSDTTSLTGKMKVMGSQTLYPLMVKWASLFVKDHPAVNIDVRGTYSSIGLQNLLDGKTDIAMVSRPLTNEEKANGLWCAPVALDAVVPVICFNNSQIQTLVMKGLSKEKLKQVFTGKISNWGQLTGKASKDKIVVYIESDSSGTAATMNAFLGIKPGEAKGTKATSGDQMIKYIASAPAGIGYCSIMNAYNIKTGFRKDGIYILPIDINADGVVQDNEQIFDKFSQISNAVSTGKLSKPPARDLYLVTKTKPTDKLIKAFISWALTIGQNYTEELGYINIPIEQANTAMDAMK